jgi:IS605 OrfB family transposase
VVCRLILGPRHHALLVDPTWTVGGADLVWRRGVSSLHVTQSREAPAPPEPEGGTLGVDLGLVTRATDSEGEQFTGAMVQVVRSRYHLRRQRLQQVGTRNAKRRLRQLAGREARVQRDVHHCISKALVTTAVVSRTALALEDLRGIRERVTVRREHRYARHAWAFFQLRQCLAYPVSRLQGSVGRCARASGGPA